MKDKEISLIKARGFGRRNIIPKDPIKVCKVYKTTGCAHVDGFLCDTDTCRDKLELDLWELEEQLNIPHRLRYYKTLD